MKLSTIDMERGPARQAFLEYRHSVAALTDREAETYDERKRAVLAEQRERDEAIMRGYRVLSLGRQIVDLRATIAAGGVDEHLRPRLAIARADRQRVSMVRHRDGSVTFGLPSRYGPDPTNPRSLSQIALPAGTLPAIDQVPQPWQGGLRASAIVPMIPPRFRPAQLTRYHVLWEADWQAAPVDPALLRRARLSRAAPVIRAGERPARAA